MYTGYELSEDSRNKLKQIFPPKYSELLGHHITHKFGTKNENDIPDQPNTVQVVGYVDDGKGIEGLLVEIDGTTKRADGSLFHITWSLDRSQGYKPAHTNNIIEGATPLKKPVSITVTPKMFNGPTPKTLRDFVEEKKLTNL
jgi:hypothetical protein